MNFREFLKSNIVVLDGGMGTLLQAKGLKTGELPEIWNITHPDIIKDILVGMDGSLTPYKVIENRIDAIKYAISSAQKDDIIVLAGKGHERYEIGAFGRRPFDERVIVREAYARRKEKNL